MWISCSSAHLAARRWCPASRPGAFTLVEVLVSMSVLVLLVVCVTQLTNGTASTVTESRKFIDADSQARSIFSRMSVEFANIVQRTDIDYSAFKHPAYSFSSTTFSPASGFNTTSVPVAANSQTGNDQFAFYFAGTGYYSGGANPGAPVPFTGNQREPVSLVAYMINTDSFRTKPTDTQSFMDLQRVSEAIGWEPNAGGSWQNITFLPRLMSAQWPTLFTTNPDYTSVGDEVIRFEYTYLLKANPASGATAKLSVTPWDQTATPAHNLGLNGMNDVAAVVVAIAVMDPASRLLVNSGSIANLSTVLPDAAEGQDIKASWDAVINNTPSFASAAQIPPTAAASVRVFQRYFYLDGH